VSLNEQLEKEISERKVIEHNLITMRDKADAANQAKSRFLANMSHELRTPLNAIIGYSEMLQDVVTDEHLDREEITGDLDKIGSAGKHLLHLINDVLDISKIEAGKMNVSYEHFSVDELLKQVIDTIVPLAEARHNRLTLEIQQNVGSIESDPVKLRQILLNLLSNAVKFTQEGRVDLLCTLEHRDDKEWVVFHVRDTGIGIAPEHVRRIFRPFDQADTSTTRKYGGTGLGLTISHSFVDMLGGEIQVASEPGRGSVFSVSLPRQRSVPRALREIDDNRQLE
jgi:signal transduction histidine kinase